MGREMEVSACSTWAGASLAVAGQGRAGSWPSPLQGEREGQRGALGKAWEAPGSYLLEWVIPPHPLFFFVSDSRRSKQRGPSL